MKIELITSEEREQMYDDMLDDCYPDFEIAGIKYTTSNVLKEVDPVAYRCGMNDNDDSLKDSGYFYEEDYELGKDYFMCPECGDYYDDKDEAKECCGVLE